MIQAYIEQFVAEEDKEAIRMTYDPEYIEEKIALGAREVSVECRILLHGEERWVRNVIIRDEAMDASRYAIVFIRDITDAKRNAANIQELANEKQSLDLLVQGTVKLVDRYAMCDLETDQY